MTEPPTPLGAEPEATPAASRTINAAGPLAPADAREAEPLPDPLTIARESAARMWAADVASQDLGMRLDEVRPGYARLSMSIVERMLNGHGIAHGGFVFTLADSAFAFACNSYGPMAVAAHCDVTFLAPTRAGDELVAEAVERVRSGRSGVYDVTVRREGVVIAEFRGHSRVVPPPAG